MLQKIKRIPFFLIIISIILQVTDIHSNEKKYKILGIEKLSRYNEDRMAYQQIEIAPIEYEENRTDNSIASLLIVKDKKIYLFKDGYDNPKTVFLMKKILEMENKLIPDMWINKIDNSPDFLRVTERRIELQKKIADQYGSSSGKQEEKNLKPMFVNLYKNARNKLIQKHVQIFKTLLIDRKESGLFVVKKPLPKRVYDTGPTKYFTSVTGKTIDSKIYYAEDADGDGITETFTVNIPDGFHWGFNSGPNIIFIYQNSQEEVKKIIGKLAHYAYYGTPEEEKALEKTFLTQDDINYMIDDIYRMTSDQKKLLNTK